MAGAPPEDPEEDEPLGAEPPDPEPDAADEPPPEPRGGGRLLVVATPIGNLGDLTLRAADALRAAQIVAAEDTRRARGLLSHLGIEKKELVRLDEHAPQGQIDRLAERIAAGAICALVTDAGTPVVSDPGSALVRAVRDRGAHVEPIPGVSAVTAALSVAGYAMQAFRFVGFLPRKGRERAEALLAIERDRDCVVLFESPHRVGATLAELGARMPDRRVLVARELTKRHEELIEGPLAEVSDAHAARSWLGELTLVLAPYEAAPAAEAPQVLDDAALDARIDAQLAEGRRPREVADDLARETARPRREVYARVLARRDA